MGRYLRSPAELSLPLGTVKSRIHRALRTLRAQSRRVNGMDEHLTEEQLLQLALSDQRPEGQGGMRPARDILRRVPSVPPAWWRCAMS